ncbi:MAG TPA: phosphatidate cytidylyltransferase, partial [Kineosporiaceae bacterium]|nr:phosphatidate cytidylyltransferase [Kineosporiaceae bacterium]
GADDAPAVPAADPGPRGSRRGAAPRAAGEDADAGRPALRAVPAAGEEQSTQLMRPVRAADPFPPPTPGEWGPAAAAASGPRPDEPASGDLPAVAAAAGRSRRSGTRRSSGSTAALSAVPAPAAGRAGRNLPAAIGVGLALAVAVVASLFVRKEAFVVLVAAAVVGALWELTTALAKKAIVVPLVPLAVGAVGMLVSAFVAGEDGLLVSFTLTAFGVLLWRIIDGAEGAARDVAAAVFVAAYVPFLAGFAMLMLAERDGPARVLVFVAVTVANDVGGYASGVLFGRHPMAPSISPKKSWEGLSGSLVLCMAVGAATVHFVLHGPVLAGLAVGVAAALTATLGDLSESLLKRDLGIKDMGTLLPGHGGIMDRLDSLLPTAPAVALLLMLLVPVG